MPSHNNRKKIAVIGTGISGLACAWLLIKRLNREQNITMLLVEQNAHLALSIAEHGYVMENGKIVLDDSVEKLKDEK